MANTAFVTDGKGGIDLDAKGSTAAFGLLTPASASDGRVYVFAIAGAALASAATITIASGGTATALTAGTFVVGTTGGVASGQYFWAKDGTLG